MFISTTQCMFCIGILLSLFHSHYCMLGFFKTFIHHLFSYVRTCLTAVTWRGFGRWLEFVPSTTSCTKSWHVANTSTSSPESREWMKRIRLILLVFICRNEGRKEEGNVLFNDTLNTFYLPLYGVRHMVKDHSDSEIGNPLPPHRLLFPISSKGSFKCIIPQTA